MNRRGFLGAMLAACAAPAIVRAESLMKPRGIIIPRLPRGGSVVEGMYGFDELRFTSHEMVLQIDEFSSRIILPAMRAIADGIDADILRSLR